MKRNKKYLCVDINKWFPRRYLSLEVWRYELYRLFTKSIMIMDFCWKWRQLIHLFCLNNRIQVDHARNEQKIRCKFTAGVKSWSHCANIACSPTGHSIALFISESFIFCTEVSLHLLPFAILPPVQKMKERSTKLSQCEVTHLATL